MYAHQDGYVEECCYDYDHNAAVLDSLGNNFDKYFDRFIETEAGLLLSETDYNELKKKFNVIIDKKSSNRNRDNFKLILEEAYENFEKDRQKYLDIFDEEALEEWEDDPATFKSKVLKQECPIIHSTMYNKRAKELDEYRKKFKIADPEELLSTVKRLFEFANEYMSDVYDEDDYEYAHYYDDLCVGELDTEDYTVYGVIGGGIKSHMLYKYQPSVFPNRSRNAIWALWYLTNKEKFGCTMDSEFIMIDVEKSIAQQNYFYPYELFAFYALAIYNLISNKAKEMDVFIDPSYRYVIVDAFLNYVADEHSEEISLLKSQIRDGGLGYA